MANPIKYTLATNLVNYSEQFSDVYWNKAVATTVTSNTSLAPDGTLTADTVTFTTQFGAVRKDPILTSGTVTISLYIKNINGNTNLNLRATSSGLIYNQSITITNEWQRYTGTFTYNGVNQLGFVFQDRNTSGFGSCLIWGAQFELGRVATTYIRTTASSVTVNATASNSIKTSNFAIGVNKGGYGPTNITNFYNGKTPNIGGYTVYVSNGSGSPSPFVASNDAALITLSNQLGGSGIATISAALNFFNSSTTMLCTNMDYPNIVTSGLVLNLDAAYTPSFPKSGTTWTDLSGNGNNGTLVNGPSYSSLDGGSISFDGVDDYVLFSEIILSGNFTISQIVNLSGTGNGPMPIGGGLYSNGSTYKGYVWFRNSVNEVRLAVNDEQTVIFSINSSLWVNKTILYTVRRQGTIATFYIDGVEITSGTISTNNFNIRTIGYSYVFAYASLGTISNTMIYNRALSATEVLQNYYAGLQRFIPTDSLVLSLDGSNTDKQVATASFAYDMSGNNYIGVLTNGVTLSSDGQRTFLFDGINDNIVLGNILNIGTNDLTINTWIKLATSPNTDNYIFSKSFYGGQNYRYGFSISSNKLSTFLQGNGGSDIFPSGSTTLSSNVWYMVTTVIERSSTIKMYVNGILETLTGNATISQWVGLNFQSSNPARVGSYTFSDNVSSYATFKGSISQVRIYNRTLTATEILTMYNATKSRYDL